MQTRYPYLRERRTYKKLPVGSTVAATGATPKVCIPGFVTVAGFIGVRL